MKASRKLDVPLRAVRRATEEMSAIAMSPTGPNDCQPVGCCGAHEGHRTDVMIRLSFAGQLLVLDRGTVQTGSVSKVTAHHFALTDGVGAPGDGAIALRSELLREIGLEVDLSQSSLRRSLM